ncbi:alpha-L-fucosidase [Anaerocolumna xylanovorans]|uniref:alpha-L-fucosidase n=1 Tax=Anaerocolumna xylanovorans DSM 12503 TaxID=1121345 RepID=A0A1M7Y643_9FIRM|nr:alpha-L-fucosidase [Anaerocolumna xylanovorans]SHO48117.1 alpha-L-fucosidase [Anaerocolumna xylanovorans DSM 12503]
MGLFKERAKRTEWFMDARFGMFIHWGLYAIPARGEWVRSTEKMSIETYNQYFEEFNPVRYNPKEWAKLAKEAGMKYAVLTTKHHDGFCLFDSAYTDYKSTNTKCKRDLVKEYVEAFREEGIKIGFYYSLLDWHHPDYPHYGDRQHPMREEESFKNAKHNWKNYVEYFHGQVRELLTNYGKIDLMWFDFSYENENLKGTEFEHMSEETWGAKELVTMMRELQPEIVIDNRLGGDARKEEPDLHAGDFVSPECIMPSSEEVDSLGRSIPWELCLTLNENWGYAKNKPWEYKSTENVIHMLVECVSKNGNMLINVGPNAKGEIPRESIRVLKEIGEWMRVNSDSIYGCKKSELEKPEWGRYTQKGNMLYAHIFDRGVGSFRLPGLEGRIKKARILEDGAEVRIERPWNGSEYPKDAFVQLEIAGLYDEKDTVLELELKS